MRTFLVRFSGGSAFLFNNVRGGGELIPLVEGVISQPRSLGKVLCVCIVDLLGGEARSNGTGVRDAGGRYRRAIIAGITFGLKPAIFTRTLLISADEVIE